MKKRKVIACILALVLALSMLAGCGAQKGEEGLSPYSGLISDFYEACDTEFAYDIAHTLAYDEKYLSNELGFRTAGSDAEHAAADYLAGVMTDIGLAEIEKVPVKVDKWQFNGASLKLAGDAYEVMPASYATSGTDKNGIAAEMVDAGSGMAEDYEGLDVKGKIVLVGVDQWNGFWIDSYLKEAAVRGAAAIVTYDTGGYAAISDDAVNLQDVCAKDLIPCVSISQKDGAYFAAKIAAGSNQATLFVDNEIAIDKGVSYNVTGKIPGKSSEQQIIISGHYDTYFNAFQDDCSAIGLILAMAKAMTDSGYTPENDIVFVCHGAEEWGASGSANDWTIGAWRMIHEAKPEWAGKTIAMLNFELPAYYAGDKQTYFSAVPEFTSLVSNLVNEANYLNDIDTSIYPQGISDEAVPTNTMEDGISYRFAGVPYLINVPSSGSEWMQERYHTVYDNAETYSEEVMNVNLKMFGAMAIYIDQSPALMMDMTATCDLLKGALNEELAKDAGADTDAYQAALNALSTAAGELSAKVSEINAAYEQAYIKGDADTMANLRAEGLALNKVQLKAFKDIQDNLVGIIATMEVTVRHEAAMRGAELIMGVLEALEKEELENKDETGALDLAWMANGMTDYLYYCFSPESTENHYNIMLDETNPGRTFWGSGKEDPPADTVPGIYAMFEGDFETAISVYKQALAFKQGQLAGHMDAETKAMQQITAVITHQ